MKKIYFLFLLVFASAQTFAQNGSIDGKVFDEDNQALSFANIILYTSEDSTFTKAEYTKDDGSFELNNITPDNYFIKVNYVGLPDYYIDAFELTPNQDLVLGSIKMNSPGTEIDEVTIIAKRPLLEMKPDMVVFNVQGSINASGNDGMELLRKSPGVIIDNNDNITLLGKSGVKIYIDGKPSPLNGEDLASYLRSLQSTQIDKIEIITNPSAKYEAEGNAGIINIRLVKNQNVGGHANLSLNYSVGERSQYSGSINSNYRLEKMNIFGSYNYRDGKSINYFDLYRVQAGYIFDQTNTAENEWTGHNIKFGTDFYLNKKSTFGFQINGNMNDRNWASASRTPISTEIDNELQSVLVANSNDVGERSNFNYNLNYRLNTSEDASLSIDADYGRYRSDGNALQPNTYYDPTETTILLSTASRTIKPKNIDIYTFKLDYEMPFASGKLGFGGKYADVRTDNTFDFFNVVDEMDILDIERSNQFDYTERVSAAYANYSKQMEKFNFQLGLRVEHTKSSADLTAMVPIPAEDDLIERSYTDLFPSAGITWTPSQKHMFQLNYSRRLNRPSYQDMNPFRNKLDELTFERGNPFLNPEYTNNFQLTHSFNYQLNTTIAFSHTTDLITQLTDIDPLNPQGGFITWENLADQYNYSINISSPRSITNWWNSFVSVTGYIMDNSADYGDGKVIDLNQKSLNIYSQQTFSLPGDVSFEISGWYNSPSLWGGTFQSDAMGSVDAGIQKKLFGGKGNLKLSVSDIFKTSDWSAISQFGELFIDGTGGWDSRRFKASFSYNFGNQKLKTRARKTGLEDEKSRIKSDGK
jgi:outer membrane receptor protein involved in Fe transport